MQPRMLNTDRVKFPLQALKHTRTRIILGIGTKKNEKKKNEKDRTQEKRGPIAMRLR